MHGQTGQNHYASGHDTLGGSIKSEHYRFLSNPLRNYHSPALNLRPYHTHTHTLKPYTTRTHTADVTQLSSWVASKFWLVMRCVLNSQLAHDNCRRIWSKNWKLNMFTIYPAELSCVGGVYAPIGCRDPVYNAAAIGYGCRIVKLGHDCWRVRSYRRHDATRLCCRQICSDSPRLSPIVGNSIVHTADATQLDSCIASAVCIGF